MSTGVIILFIAGICSICVLFSSLIIFPDIFPIVSMIYAIGLTTVILVMFHNINKENSKLSESGQTTLQRLKYISIFNIIVSLFIIVVLVFKMVTKPTPLKY